MERNLLVGFLDRGRLQIAGGVSATPSYLDLDPSAVRDLEVISKVKLEEQIRTWVETHKLGAASLILVLSEAVYFATELTGETLSKQETETQAFIDTVPFEELVVKHYTLQNKHLVVAANKELLEAFQQSLGLVGLRVIAIVPQITLGNFASHRWLDEAMVKFVASQASSLIGQSLLEAKDTSAASRSTTPVKVAGINRLWIFLGIFIILVIILIFLLIPH